MGEEMKNMEALTLGDRGRKPTRKKSRDQDLEAGQSLGMEE
jgi:hypothetical protein